MVTLIFEFPARRYHATPWGHHVNEGLVEWPPSPWRVLRALIATGYTACRWTGAEPPPEARSLIEKLAGVLPRYYLPLAAGAHSRHFMPTARFKGGREDKTLVFDTWAQVDEGKLAIAWEADLSAGESSLLRDLASRLGYLGRSESWVTARLANHDDILPDSPECRPCEEFEAPKPGWEQVPLLAAQPGDIYMQWRRAAVASELEKLPSLDASKKKLSKDEKSILKQREAVENPYPRDLITCLQATTAWLHEHGWSQPPGSRRVFYWRRSDSLETGMPRALPVCVHAPPVEAILVSMATSNRNDAPLPSVIRTLPQAELLHRALVSTADRQHPGHCEVLRGCDGNGRPLVGRHEHAHILPLDLDLDGHLDHFLIWAPMGLDMVAQAAVRAVRQTFTKGVDSPLRLALAGSGSLDDLRRLPGPYGDGLRSVLGPPDGAVEWISLTPFVPPRHLKIRGRNTMEGQIAAELASRGLPASARVRLVDPRENPAMMRQRHFIRSRRKGPPPPIDCSFQIALEFARPVCGPLCLGYASHFGLGLFTATG